MKHITLITLLLMLSACVNAPLLHEFAKFPGAPGYITEHTSEFDGGREVVMDPGWTNGSVRLGLFWRSTMPADVVHLSAQLKGAHNLGTLSLNIDGEILHFEPVDTVTEIWTEPAVQYWGATNWSKREYQVTRQLVERMIAGQRVVVRVDTMHGYSEGIFTFDQPTAARPAFQDFHARVWGPADQAKK